MKPTILFSIVILACCRVYADPPRYTVCLLYEDTNGKIKVYSQQCHPWDEPKKLFLVRAFTPNGVKQYTITNNPKVDAYGVMSLHLLDGEIMVAKFSDFELRAVAVCKLPLTPLNAKLREQWIEWDRGRCKP